MPDHSTHFPEPSAAPGIELVSGRGIGTDSTHVNACAFRTSEYLAEMEEEPGVYWDRLDRYEEPSQKELAQKTGRRQKKRAKPIKRGRKWVSRVEYLNRPGKPKGMHCLSRQTLDTDHGIIPDVTVTFGDTSDAVPYLVQLESVHLEIVSIRYATADAAFDFPLANRVTEHAPAQFERFVLGLFDGEKRLRAYPRKENCLSECRKQSARKLEHNYFEPAVRRGLNRQAAPEYREALGLRQIWCEDTIAAQKWGYNLTHVLR